jgi:hypothetical protein
MSRSIFFIVYLFHAAACLSQQKILLIGTLHQTPKERLKEIPPVASTVESFHPEVICAEYPMPTDTASVKYKWGEDIFLQKETKLKEWNIPSGNLNVEIELLKQDPKLTSDIKNRMELQQLYFLSSDMVNAAYQGYQIMTKTESDSQNATWISEKFPGYKSMKDVYEIQRYRNDEYYHLVFPLAVKLSIPYIYPIDDLSTWTAYEKYFDRLQVLDTTDADKKKFHKYTEDYLRKLKSLPIDSNEWFFLNSPEIILNAIYGTGYAIDPGLSNEDIKMLHHYWVLRNKKMAQHIHDVAQKYPNKRLVVFFGAGHIGSVREELHKFNKSYQVLTLFDLRSK